MHLNTDLLYHFSFARRCQADRETKKFIMAAVSIAVLLLRESAAVLNPDCIKCQEQVLNCTVTASTGELVCRAPDNCTSSATKEFNCGGVGSDCFVAIDFTNNSSSRVHYRTGHICRSISQTNVSIHNMSQCVRVFDPSRLSFICLCNTSSCNKQFVLTGFATPVPIIPSPSPDGSLDASPGPSPDGNLSPDAVEKYQKLHCCMVRTHFMLQCHSTLV